MKKLFLTILSLCLMLSAWAYDFTVDGIYYTITSSTSPYTVKVTYATSSYNSYSGDIVIPSFVSYNGLTYAVTAIGDSGFGGCSGLTSVTIPTSVTSIDANAFSGCSGLTSVKIPGNVTSIGNSAFNNCSGLISITLSKGIKTIGDYGFSNCSKLSSLTLPSSLTALGRCAFAWCAELDSVTINSIACNSTGGSDYPAFKVCNNLTTLIVGDSATTLPSFAFYNVSSLKTVNISSNSSLENFGTSTFAYCTKITSITIPKGATSIGFSPFYGCTGITAVVIPSSVTYLGNSAFASCSNLKTVVIETPSESTSISERAFKDCSLASINIPASVKSIGSQAFAYCTNLTSIYTNTATPVYLSLSLNVFRNVNKSTCILHVPVGSKAAYQAANQWQDFLNIVEDVTTSTFNAQASNLKINISKDNAEISGMPLGESVTVYNLQGVAIYNQKATEETISVNLPARGIYIVKVGSQSMKVIN